jgi:nicotinamidase-related amidase
VIKTALDAIKEGFEVYLVSDAISSRKKSDWETAIARASQSGAWNVSTEMIIFQLMQKAGTDEFKEIQKIVR